MQKTWAKLFRFEVNRLSWPWRGCTSVKWTNFLALVGTREKLAGLKKNVWKRTRQTIQTKRMFSTSLPGIMRTFWLNGSRRHFDWHIVMETVASNIDCRAPVKSWTAGPCVFFRRKEVNAARGYLYNQCLNRIYMVMIKRGLSLPVSNLRSFTCRLKLRDAGGCKHWGIRSLWKAMTLLIALRTHVIRCVCSKKVRKENNHLCLTLNGSFKRCH